MIYVCRAADVLGRGRLRHPGRTAMAAGVGLAFMLAAGAAAQARISLRAPPGLSFVEAENVAQLRARLDETGGRRLMVYVAADWCATCAKIERVVFPDSTVIEALAPLKLVKVDVTNLDEGRAALLKELQVAGPPTMVFFGAAKQEAEGTRLVGAIEPRELVASALKAGAQ